MSDEILISHVPVYTVHIWLSISVIHATKSCTLQGKSTREIHGIDGCITPSRVIILRSNVNMHCPIILIDIMNPGAQHKLLETPGMKCTVIPKKIRIFECTYLTKVQPHNGCC